MRTKLINPAPFFHGVLTHAKKNNDTNPRGKPRGFEKVLDKTDTAKKKHLSNTNTGGAGFTLVEILIVVAILGILATALISLINPTLQIQKSRDARRKSDLRQIQSALELYRADCGSYPARSGTSVPSPLTSVSPPVTSPSTCAGSGVTYMQTVPIDPKSPARIYTYQIVGSGGYTLTACLENIRDPEGGSACPSGLTYSVSSP